MSRLYQKSGTIIPYSSNDICGSSFNGGVSTYVPLIGFGSSMNYILLENNNINYDNQNTSNKEFSFVVPKNGTIKSFYTTIRFVADQEMQLNSTITVHPTIYKASDNSLLFTPFFSLSTMPISQVLRGTVINLKNNKLNLTVKEGDRLLLAVRLTVNIDVAYDLTYLLSGGILII